MADLGHQPFDDLVKTQAPVVRAVREMPRPGDGHGVVAHHQRIDVVGNDTARDLDRVLVVVARTLRSVTGRCVAVVDVVR
jgi:hypothetical protein